MLMWLEAVALALAKHGCRAHLNRLYDDAPRIRGDRPATFDSIVRGTLEAHSSDSQTFRDGQSDFFTAPDGLGAGVWSIRDRAWTISDVITRVGQAYLLFDVIDAFPPVPLSNAESRVQLRRQLGAKNLIAFAQQTMPKLSFWRKAE